MAAIIESENKDSKKTFEIQDKAVFFKSFLALLPQFIT